MIHIKPIIKFIEHLYKPSAIDYNVHDNPDGPPESVLHLYFDDIDDKYLKNPMARDPIENKEKNLEYEIRDYVEKLFGQKTTGLTITRVNSPTVSFWEKHGLTINVYCKRSD